MCGVTLYDALCKRCQKIHDAINWDSDIAFEVLERLLCKDCKKLDTQ